MNLYRILALLFLVVGAWFMPQPKAYAQIVPNNTNVRINCIYIYNFTKYIQWPPASSTGDFVIGVLGDSPIITELEKLAQTKKVNDRNIVIRKLKTPNATGLHMLYIPASESDALSQSLQSVGENTLVITEKPGLAKIGSYINFVSMGGKPRFELNMGALSKTNLKVLSQLKTIAIMV